MSRPLVCHGTRFEIVALNDLPPGACGVALQGSAERPLRVQRGPCERFDVDGSVRHLDSVRARLLDDLQRLDEALRQLPSAGAALPVVGAEQPVPRLRMLPRLVAGGVVAAAIFIDPVTMGMATGPALIVMSVLHFVIGASRPVPASDPDVEGLGWPVAGWGLLTFILWLSFVGYAEEYTLANAFSTWVLPLVLATTAGLSIGHWIRLVLLTGRAAPRPGPLILAVPPDASVPSGAAVYDVSLNGQWHTCLGVPVPLGGLALLPFDAALADPAEVGRFAGSVLAYRARHQTTAERRAELAARVDAVEDALRELEADTGGGAPGQGAASSRDPVPGP